MVGGFASLTVGLGLMVTATAVSHHHAPGAAEGLWVAAWILFLPGPVCVVALLARFLQVRPRIRPRSTETALQVQGSEAQVVALCQKALAMQRFKGISVENDGMIVARLRTTGQRRRSQIEVRVEPTESGVLVHARCEARPESAASLFRHPSELVVAKFASGLSALTVVCRIQRGAQGDPQLFDASSQRISEPGSAHGLPEDRGVNGLAVAALVLGILWIFWVGSILAAIFGHIGLGQIRRRGQSGRGMALAGVLLGWAGIAVLVSAVVLATVTGLNAEDRKPPAQILRDAISASEKASSVHLSGWSGGSSSSLANVDLVLSKGASGGSIIESEGTFGLVVANGYVYLKADASFWQQTTGDPSAAQTLGGRWIKGSEKSSDFSGFSKLTQVFGQIKVRGKLFKESDVQLDGMSVIPLTDSRGDDDLRGRHRAASHRANCPQRTIARRPRAGESRRVRHRTGTVGPHWRDRHDLLAVGLIAGDARARRRPVAIAWRDSRRSRPPMTAGRRREPKGPPGRTLGGLAATSRHRGPGSRSDRRRSSWC